MSLGEYLGAGASLTNGLWHLNGDSNDSSGNAINGTDTSVSYGLSYGKFGQGALFNGTSSKISLGTGLNATGSFTISAWFKTTSLSATHTIFSKRSSSTSQYALSTTSSGYLLFNIFNTSEGNYLSATTSSALSTGVWYHALATFNNTSACYLYINGLLKASGTSTSGTRRSSSTANVAIGARYTTAWEAFYPGNIDEVIFEQQYWTPQMVAKYYANSLGRFAPVLN
jgi:hypothetical protein